MSDLRIALVCEGDTDLVIIEAALKAVQGRTFVLTKLQPEATRPILGSGWTGVLKWCDAAGQRHAGSLDTDPSLGNFDLLIIHLDVDVAGASYVNAGPAIVANALEKSWEPLPCAQPCPPVGNSCARLTTVLHSWLARATVGTKTVLCLPAQSSGTWLAVATLPVGHALLASAECNVNLESALSQLPLALRIKKQVREYRTHASRVTQNWDAVKAQCTQAQAFEHAVLAAV
jgi:hypothetical protein